MQDLVRWVGLWCGVVRDNGALANVKVNVELRLV